MSASVGKLLSLIMTVVAVTFSSPPSASAQEAATPPDAAQSAVGVAAWNALALRTIMTENRREMPSSEVYLGSAYIAAFDATGAVRPTAVMPATPSTSPTRPAPTVLPHPDSYPHWCRRWLPCAR